MTTGKTCNQNLRAIINLLRNCYVRTSYHRSLSNNSHDKPTTSTSTLTPPTPTPAHSKAWMCLSNFLTIQLQFLSAFCRRCLLALAVTRPSLPLTALCTRIAASLSVEGRDTARSHGHKFWPRPHKHMLLQTRF